jgi:hypothetical protein
MNSAAALCPQPKLVYVDYRGIQSHRYTPGALTSKQFDAYVQMLQLGVGRETARKMAAETPKR